MKARIIGMRDVQEFESTDDLISRASELGLTFLGAEPRADILPELQGLPKFKELAGPLGGDKTSSGEPCARYETWEAFNHLSS